MTATLERIRALFDEIDRTPWGPQERALVAEAVALAQESGDTRLEYEARLRQTSSANMIGDTDLMLTSFAWCLAQHDADPERFPAELEPAGDLLWQYKWMAGALRGSPEFSTEQIDAVLDDMERHYQRAGIGMSGALMARFEDAWAAGRMDEASALRDRIDATPRDDHSHCDACVRSQFAGFFAETGREDEAIRLVREMVEGGFSCGEEPERGLGRTLLPSLRAGLLDDARTAHLRSYRLAKDNPDNLPIIADNVVFCAVTGNEARALALVEKHLSWLLHDGLNAEAHREALGSFALALDAVSAAGHPDAPVRGSDATDLAPLLGAHDGPWAASALAARLWQLSDEIAAAFDRRNGTDAHARRQERLRAVAAERYDVPLSSHAFAPRVAPAAPRTAAQRIARARALSDVGSSASVAAIEEVLAEATVDELPELTRQWVRGLTALDRREDARQAFPARISALRNAGQGVRADLEQELGAVMFDPERADVAAAALEAHPEAPVGLRGDLLSIVGFQHLVGGRPDEALQTARLAHDAFVDAAEPARAHGMRQLESDVLRAVGAIDEATGVLDALLGDDTLGIGRRARVLMDRAVLRAENGAPDEGADDADAAVRILMELDADDALLGSVLALAAQLSERADRPARAVATYRLAVQRFEAAGIPTVGARFGLGRALVSMGAAHEAIDVIDDVLRDETDAGEAPGSRAMTAGLLARAFERAEEWGSAVRAWEFTADLHAEADEHAARASALVALGRLLGRLGELDDAIDTLTAAVELARADDDAVGMLADALHTLAQAREQRGDDDSLTVLDEALDIGRANDAPWFVADALDTKARMFAQRGRIDDAVALALQAADGFAQLGAVESAGASELLAARVLVSAARGDEAVAVFRSALDHAEGAEPLRDVIALELGDALEALGRHAEAADVRRTVAS